MDQVHRLVELMARLRAEGGCPWDREQTHESLKPYLLEECYEVLEAVDSGHPAKLCEELGDLLLQIVFHAELAAEEGRFDLQAIARCIADKLEHRHPHVFGTVQVRDSDEVVDNWEVLKRAEPRNADRASALDGVPHVLPALARATAVQKAAAKVGFDWPDAAGPAAKVEEELQELAAAREQADVRRTADEWGDLFFALVNLTRFARVDAEEALRVATQRFEERFRAVERMADEQGRQLSAMTLEEMDVLWEAVKSEVASRQSSEDG